ncbi:40S ribosomal protein S19-like [Iris pallida]|uniref:40S ribosomal protein S19-like n=1 Tax=Iris pallida TaxID=29817 RepID=A0AAX6EWV7_IRIPA|nr:40S ribosomal protein S19-like [Iris pallida]
MSCKEKEPALILLGYYQTVSDTLSCALRYVSHVQMELPHWTDIVKTGRFKELASYDPDWYYIRAASMARKIYLRQGLGVGGFQKIYGGRKRNGSRPPHLRKSSGAVARHILQLQQMNIVDVHPKGGRIITSQGRRDLDQVAGRIVVDS